MSSHTSLNNSPREFLLTLGAAHRHASSILFLRVNAISTLSQIYGKKIATNLAEARSQPPFAGCIALGRVDAESSPVEVRLWILPRVSQKPRHRTQQERTAVFKHCLGTTFLWRWCEQKQHVNLSPKQEHTVAKFSAWIAAVFTTQLDNSFIYPQLFLLMLNNKFVT